MTIRARRRPIEGGYPRGEETRGRIVDAAIRVFADEGYERASTRRIADEASVRPPALQYYFDSKEGLHRACAQTQLAFVGESFGSALERAARAPTSPEDACERACELMDVLVGAALDKRTPSARARFLARLQADQAGPAWPVIRDGLLLPLHASMSRLVAAVSGRPLDTEIRLRASLILGQVSALSVSRETTFIAIGWTALSDAEKRLILNVVRTHTLAILGIRP